VEWADEGFVLSGRRYGESGLILHVLTQAHGRHAGLVRGGASRRVRGLYEPGNRITVTWRARLEDHLGGFRCELIDGHAAMLLDQADRLSALSALCALAETALPEREPHGRLFRIFERFLTAESEAEWLSAYIEWEMTLLADLGYGLDLSRCAATGSTDDLAFVSPKSGRAVSRAAGQPYTDRLLALPPVLLGGAVAADVDEVRQALAATGYFLAHRAYAALDRDLPPARQRFVDRLARKATISRG